MPRFTPSSILIALAITVELAAPACVFAGAVDQYGEPLPAGAVAKLGAECFRHEGKIWALAFAADGKTLAGYTVGAGIVVWDAQSGHVRQCLPMNLATNSFALAISADGALVAAIEGPPWGKQYKIRVWNTLTGKPAGTLPLADDQGATVPASPLSFAPDGRSLAVSAGGRALVFDIRSAKLHASLGQQGWQSFRCAFSSDSKILASAVHAGRQKATSPDDSPIALQLWNRAAGKLIRVIGDLPPLDAKGRPGPMAFAPDDKSLAYASGDRLLLLDTATGKRLAELDGKVGRITDLAFTADGSRLVSNSDTGAILVWNTRTHKITRTIDKGPSIERCMALAAATQTLAVSTPATDAISAQTVRLWNIATGQEGASREQGHEVAVNFLAWSADGKTLVSGADDKILFWNDDFKRRGDIVPGRLKLLASSPQGQLAVVERVRHETGFGATATALHIMNIASPEVSKTLALPSRPIVETATYSPDGRKLFTLETQYTFGGNALEHFRIEALRQWSVPSAKEEHSWRIPFFEGSPFSAGFRAFAGVNGKAVLGVQRRKLGVYDVESTRTRMFEELAKVDVQFISPSPNARLVALALRDGPNGLANPNVLLVEMITGKRTMLLKGDTARVSAGAWSSDSRILAIGDVRPTYSVPDNVHIHLWDALTGKKICRIGGVNADVTALSFAPDGGRLAVGLRDGSIYIFAVPSPKLNDVPAAALSRDQVEECWKKLLGDDAGAAHRAVGVLAAFPTVAVPLLASRLRPVGLPNKARIRQLIIDLDSPTFTIRQSATKELQAFGREGLIYIRLALKEKLTLEAHRRLEQIVKNQPDIPGPETVRTVRATMVLEQIGTKDTRAVLDTIAAGAPGARETEEAKASLQRLANRLPR